MNNTITQSNAIHLDTYMINKILNNDTSSPLPSPPPQIHPPSFIDTKPKYKKSKQSNKRKEIEEESDDDESDDESNKEEYKEEKHLNIFIECVLLGGLFYIFTNNIIQTQFITIIQEFTKSPTMITNSIWILFIIVWYIIRMHVIKFFLN